MRSQTIVLTFDVEVFYEEQVDLSYGADADGRRGVRRVEWHPLWAEVQQVVPPPVAQYLKQAAMQRFMEEEINVSVERETD